MGNYASVVLGDKPIRYYRFGETSGTTALDQSANLSNGTLHGGVTLNQTGLLTADTDPCMLFNGSTGYISLPTTGLPTAAHAWSMEAWCQPSAIGGNSPVVCFFGTFSGLQGAEMWVDATHFYCASVSVQGVTLAQTPIIGQTYHLVGTYDGTNIRLYINSTLVGTSSSITFAITTGVAYIGNDDLSAGDSWNGYLDEVAFYNITLSATQIRNHYLAGSGTINFPVVPLTAATRDGHMTTTTRDGLGLSTKTRG